MLERDFDRLWPICRSIAGPGFRQSLDILSERMPTERLHFRTGEKIFDWTVPREWVAREAYFVDPAGRRHADFKTSNLHLLNYSTPFRGRIPFAELRAHLYTLPDQPEAVPYLTSYYQERWGFCLSQREFETLTDGMYEVFIDTELKDGHIEVGEAVLEGETKEEVLFSSYLCHPSLANNELSGPLVLAHLYSRIAAWPRRRYTYRFVVAPETIGAIAYLTKRGEHLKKNLLAGFQVTCVGDPGPFTYKKSRLGNALPDRAAARVLQGRPGVKILRFDPSQGSDERQYCSPDFNLPVGSLMRTMYGCYPEYHTSLDNKDFISFAALKESIEVYEAIAKAIEANFIWQNTLGKGEPQLGRRGLYPTLGARKKQDARVKAMLWLLNLADGTRDLLAVAEESGEPIELLVSVAVDLEKAGLLRKREGRVHVRD